MNWNNMCAACHNTRLRKNFDASSDTYHTAMAEPSVGCGACHGPMKAHLDWQESQGGSGQKDPTVVKLTPQQTLDNCAYCHSRRGELIGDFKPGDHFFDQARLTIVDHSEIFYPDGQVREEDYEFAPFLGSRMHHRGVKCLDCHNSHSGKTLLPGNLLCMRCHVGPATTAPVINPVTHSRHKVFGYDAAGLPLKVDLAAYKPAEIQETGGECVNCHMPQTVYMQRHLRHDHGFTTPDPLLTRQHGIPNACNRCHQDKDAQWALSHCDAWYGSKMDRPSRRRAQAIAAARQGTANARDGLLGLMTTEEIPYWRAVAAGLLELWATEPSVSAALLRGLEDADALVRESCVRSLQPCLDTNPQLAEQLIRPQLEDPMRNVRLAAAWALVSNVDPQSRAGRELLDSLAYNADQPVGQLQNAAYALARGQTLQALAHYEKALTWDPNSALIRHDYAVLLSTGNRHQEAVRQLETACKLEPTNAEYRYKLALALHELGNISKTIEELRTAVRLDEHHAPAWYNLGLALNSVGQADEGLTALGRAELAAPQDPRIPYASATILHGIRRTSEARKAARRALQIDPRYGPAVEFLQALPD
jgi:tetratricopeptide (TPR) repeat protein